MKALLLLSLTLVMITAHAQVLSTPQAQRSTLHSRGIYTVPNTSFHPDLNLGFKNGNAADGIATADAGSAVRLSASVHLPHGATVDSVRLYFLDYSDEDIYIALVSYENAKASGLKDIFTNATDGKTSVIRHQKAAMGSLVIDNEKNAYYLLVQPKTVWPKFANTLGIRSVVFYYH